MLAALVSLALLAAPQSGGSLGSEWSPSTGGVRAGVAAGRLIPLSSAISAVERRIPGRLLDAGVETDGGRPVYRVRWAASDGRRMDVIVDGETGAVLRQEGR